MADLTTRIENGDETFEDRMAVSERLSEPCEPSPIHAPFENVQVVIDAVDRLLPGVVIEIGNCAPHFSGWTADLSDRVPENGKPWRDVGVADTPARALLSALLKALDRDDD